MEPTAVGPAGRDERGAQASQIGNRLTSTVDAEGGGNRSTGYTANALNQYASITHASAFDVTGSAVSNASVKVNTQTAQRLGPYFRKELAADNSNQPAWKPVDIEVTLPGAGVGGGAITTRRSGHRYLAPAPETPAYDDDGNLVSDGRWVYTWDAENRLIAMEPSCMGISETDGAQRHPKGDKSVGRSSHQPTVATIAVGVPKRRLAFAYDGRSRRIRKQVYAWDAGTSTWTLNSERRFIHDQWNMVAEVDQTGNLLKSHVWGLDLSQTMQGAGGVGGLLWSTIHSDSQPSTTNYPLYDGNGNVSALADAGTATVTARYDYNAFGETVLVEGGDIAHSNPFRFSTKYEDAETGLYYYGYRYYSLELGRWLSRDPIGEGGGLNLYGMVGNDPVNRVDVLGRNPMEMVDPHFGTGVPKPEEFLPVTGDFTFTVKDITNHTAIGTIVVGVEMTRTGELRLKYDKLAQDLKRLGLTGDAANAAREALQKEFRDKGPAMFRAWTQKCSASVGMSELTG